MSIENVQLREPYPTPHHVDNAENVPKNHHVVRFRHSAYPDSDNIMFTLLALDHPQGGIHHETARIACGIIANNRFDGYLTETKAGEPVEIGIDGILQKTDYYFRISADFRGKFLAWPDSIHVTDLKDR